MYTSCLEEHNGPHLRWKITVYMKTCDGKSNNRNSLSDLQRTRCTWVWNGRIGRGNVWCAHWDKLLRLGPRLPLPFSGQSAASYWICPSFIVQLNRHRTQTCVKKKKILNLCSKVVTARWRKWPVCSLSEHLWTLHHAWTGCPSM